MMSQLTPYELACMARSSYAGLLPAAVQTNDDAKEESAQTDEVGGGATQGCRDELAQIDEVGVCSG